MAGLGAPRGVVAGGWAATLVVGLLACGTGPSKSQALDAIRSGVKEDGSCTVPLEILSKLKMQHTTKGICVPKEGADKAKVCVDALVAAEITHRLPESYMALWPDDVAAASLAVVPAYERHARNLLYSTCVELVSDLREGRLPCAEVRAERVIRVSALDETHADVRYAREVTLRPAVSAIDAACGALTRPPAESTVAFTKDPSSGWTLAPVPSAAP